MAVMAVTPAKRTAESKISPVFMRLGSGQTGYQCSVLLILFETQGYELFGQIVTFKPNARLMLCE